MSETSAASGRSATRPARGAAVVFIFVTILLDMLALGLIMPILPKLVESFVDNDTARAARIFGVFGTAWALMQFICSPILGSLSDRFGRRPVVLLSNFGLGLDYVLMALAPSLIWLFVGRVISGITSASVSTAFAYIADITPAERRAAVFGKIGAAFGAGFIIGPAIGGLLGDADPRLPFWVAAGLSFANTIYGFLILPESLPRDRRAPFRWNSANPIGALHLLRSDRILTGLSVVEFLRPARACGAAVDLRALCDLSVWLGLKDCRRNAGDGRYLRHGGAGSGHRADHSAFRRASSAGAGTGLRRRRLFHLRHCPDRAAVMARDSRDVAVGRFGRGDPVADDEKVAADQQGQLQGATSSVQSVSQLVGPFLFTLTFAYFIGAQAPMTLPGAPFFLASALVLLAFAVAAGTLSGTKLAKRKPRLDFYAGLRKFRSVRVW